MGSQSGTSEVHEKLLKACEENNTQEVKGLVSQLKGEKCKSADALGRSPLQIAVVKKNVEIVNLLLPHSNIVDAENCLFFSIVGRLHAIERAISKHISHSLEGIKSDPSDPDASYRKALVLAAEKNMYLTARQIKQGDNIMTNENNKLGIQKDQFLYYKGLVNEAYLTLFEEDPILKAFDLGETIKEAREDQQYFTAQYRQLKRELRKYTAKLLDYIESNDEANVILRGTRYDPFDFPGDCSRLKTALDREEKQFVAHAICQSKLEELWASDTRSIKTEHLWVILLFCCIIPVTYPLMAVAYILYPDWKLLRFMKAPRVKFWAQIYIYVIRLILVFSFSLTVKTYELINIPTATANFANSTHLLTDPETGHFKLRRGFAAWPYYFVFISLAGLPLWEVIQFKLAGFKDYIMSPVNWADLGKLLLYNAALVCHLIKLFQVESAVRYFQSDGDGTVSPVSRYESNDSIAMAYAYWIIPDRFYWSVTDWEILSEGFFGIANILDFARIIEVFLVVRTVGFLVVPFKVITKEVFRFLIPFAILFVAFLVGQTNLFWYYENSVRSELERIPHNGTSVHDRFTNLFSSMAYSFWSLFGMGETDGTQVETYKPIFFTQRIGAILYGGFMLICVIALLNILVAVIVDTFSSLQRDENVAWRFSRGILYQDFILPVELKLTESRSGRTSSTSKSKRKVESVLPSPFNLLEFISLCIWALVDKKVCCKREVLPERQDTTAFKEEQDREYKEVMFKIRQRYIQDVYDTNISSQKS